MSMVDGRASWVLSGVGGRLQRLTVRRARGGTATIVSPVCTVAEVCQRLRKSQRQVYRYLDAGRLEPRGKILGQWLFATGDVDALARRTVPTAFRRFFWDVQLSTLSVDRHQDFILARLLEFGDRRAIQWLLRTYARRLLIRFLRGRGGAVLPKRVWQFWALQLGLGARARRPRSWRSSGRHWGGLR